MHRRAALLAVLLLSLSGCSALLGTGPTPTTAPATPTPGTPSPTATLEPTPTATPSPYPPGYGPDGVENVSRALRAHVEALAAAESLTITNQAAVVGSDETANVSFVAAVDLAAERAFVETNVSGVGSLSRLYADGVVYARNDPADGDATYAGRNATVTPESFSGASAVRAALADATWTLEDETTVDGERAYVYTSTNLTATDRLLAPGIPREAVTAFDGEVVVTDAGVVRSVRYRATVETDGGTRTYAVHVEVSAVGATSVETPGWVEREFEG
jgi:hypothetical protein